MLGNDALEGSGVLGVGVCGLGWWVSVDSEDWFWWSFHGALFGAG
jgi:hypothetical protein